MNHNASLVYTKFTSGGLSDEARSHLAEHLSNREGAYATYVQVDDSGERMAHAEAMTVVRDEDHESNMTAERVTKELAGELEGVFSKHGVHKVRSGGVHIKSINPCEPKKYLIALNVAYDPSNADRLRDLGREVAEKHGISAHVVTRDNLSGVMVIALPVDQLDRYDEPNSAPQELASEIGKLLNSVTAIKFQRLEQFSSS